MLTLQRFFSFLCVFAMSGIVSAGPAALYRPIEGQGGMTVIKAGKPAVTIVVADDASPLIYFAAEEMRKHLGDICGGWQGTVNVIPASKATQAAQRIFLHDAVVGNKTVIPQPDHKSDISREGFTMLCDGKDLYIKGNSTRGTLNGVYAFLEEILGVRWLTWEPDGAYLPSIKELSLPKFVRTQIPSMPYRKYHFTGMWRFSPAEQYNGQIWCLRNRITYLWDLADGFTSFPQPMRDELLPAGYFFTGHNLRNIFGQYRSEMENHPEYFSLVDGKRLVDVAKAGEPDGWQFCTSNEEVRRIVADYVLKQAALHPDISVSLSPNDSGRHCECGKCRAFPSKTDAYIDFVNDICARVEKQFPETRIAFHVYWDIESPPKNKIKLHKNAFPNICPLYFGLIHNRTLDDPTTMPPYGSWKDYLDGWLPLVDQIGVYDYPDLEPGWDGETWIFTENARLYAKNDKFICYDIAAVGKDASMAQRITIYATAKVLWNAELKTEEVIKDFLYHYYGDAMDFMEAYFRVADQAYRKLPPVTAQPYFRRQMFTPAVISEMASHLSPALKNTVQEPCRSRVRRQKIEFEVLQRRRETERLQKNFQFSWKDEDLKPLLTSLNEFQSFLDQFTKSDYERITGQLKEINESLKNYELAKERQTTFKPGKFVYQDRGYQGGNARRDALKITGLFVSEWGWYLPPLKEGTMEYEFRAEEGHVFASVKAFAYTFLCYPKASADSGNPKEQSAAAAENEFSLSVDGGKTYLVLEKNKTAKLPIDITEYVKGKSSFRLRWRGRNGLDEDALFFSGGPNLEGVTE